MRSQPSTRGAAAGARCRTHPGRARARLRAVRLGRVQVSEVIVWAVCPLLGVWYWLTD